MNAPLPVVPQNLVRREFRHYFARPWRIVLIAIALQLGTVLFGAVAFFLLVLSSQAIAGASVHLWTAFTELSVLTHWFVAWAAWRSLAREWGTGRGVDLVLTPLSSSGLFLAKFLPLGAWLLSIICIQALMSTAGTLFFGPVSISFHPFLFVLGTSVSSDVLYLPIATWAIMRIHNRFKSAMIAVPGAILTLCGVKAILGGLESVVAYTTGATPLDFIGIAQYSGAALWIGSATEAAALALVAALCAPVVAKSFRGLLTREMA